VIAIGGGIGYPKNPFSKTAAPLEGFAFVIQSAP
jgi:hypothetical protein